MILFDGRPLIEYTVNNIYKVTHQATGDGNHAKKSKR